ncbi:MAG: ParB/RepB/Spo0J family partition protein [Solirubrobacteraceae bacterium]
MAKPRPGMGRGLGAILSVSAEGVRQGDDELRDLAIELIVPNPRQPRQRFDQQSLESLAGSLGERGVLQPVLVRPKPGGTYELVAGERRWRAAQIAGLHSIPAIVREREDAQALEVALVENMAREDLNPIDEARACAALVEELGLTREGVGRRVGRSRVAVSNLVRLLDLPDEAIELLKEGTLSEGHGRALLLAEDHGDRRSLAHRAAEAGWSVRVTEERARESNGRRQPRRTRRVGAEPHPDQERAATDIARALAGALGAEVQVRPTRDGRYSAQLSFSTADEAIELAERIAAQARRVELESAPAGD